MYRGSVQQEAGELLFSVQDSLDLLSSGDIADDPHGMSSVIKQEG
jgi:hypothetical protein